MLRPVYVRHWRIPHHRPLDKTMPRADCPPGAWLCALSARESAPDCRRRVKTSPACAAPPSPVWLARSLSGPELEADRTIARIRRRLPASARCPRGGAAWPPSSAPRRCRLVASASRPSRAMFTERWRSASARKSRKRASDIWCFSVISVPNMAVDVSPGVIPICWQTILGARRPASRSALAPWNETHGSGFLPLRRC